MLDCLPHNNANQGAFSSADTQALILILLGRGHVVKKYLGTRPRPRPRPIFSDTFWPIIQALQGTASPPGGQSDSACAAFPSRIHNFFCLKFSLFLSKCLMSRQVNPNGGKSEGMKYFQWWLSTRKTPNELNETTVHRSLHPPLQSNIFFNPKSRQLLSDAPLVKLGILYYY